MASSAEQIRRWNGPAILGYGFRPFFLSAAVWAGFAMAAWIGALYGAWTIPTAFGIIDWHAHEFLWGYLSAVIAGFMLTAVPNWTGRLPIVGWPLAVLWSFWAAGRIAVFFSAWIGVEMAALIDLTFLAALIFVLGREIIASRNWRNFKVVGVVALYLYANAAFHCEAVLSGSAVQEQGLRMGLSAAILLMVLIGGRIIPSFTRNWLAKRPAGFLPIPFNRVDGAIVAVSAAALVAWVIAPVSVAAGAICIAAGIANLARLARWAGWRTLGEPLVAILHAGYLFLAVGFLLLGGAIMLPDQVPYAAAVHSWTAGAIVVMTLAVMTRASLGHSGLALHATKPISLIYALGIGAGLLRLAAAFWPENTLLLEAAGLAWIGCFAAFAIVYTPILAKPAR
jgi:uncharacterized protein involved in response to NO